MIKKVMLKLWEARKRKKVVVVAISLLLLWLFASTGVVWEKAMIRRIIKRVTAPYREQIEKIEDFTLLTNQGLVYYKRTMVKGKPTYKMRSEMKQGKKKIVTVRYYNPYTLWCNLKPRQFGHLKTGRLNGQRMYLLRSNNISKLMGSSKNKKFPGKLWIDPQNWTLRQIEIFSKKLVPGKIIVSLKDYRRVDSLYIPFVTEINFPSLLTPKETRNLRKKVDEIREELKEIPREKRKLARPLVDAYLKTTENLLKGETFTTRVLAVRVNTGLPDTLFED